MDRYSGIVETAWGRIGAEIGSAGLYRIVFTPPYASPLTGEWADALLAYFAGNPIPTTLPIDLSGIPAFSRQVLLACRAIPFGVTVSYAELAAEIGCPRGARAVGQALARNPVPIAIPCHRVVGAGGRLTGFLGGLDWKRRLLQHEGISPA